MPSKPAVGTVTGWNDERGFGFVVSPGSTQRVFLHISDVVAGRPVDGDHVTYTTAFGTDGRVQARKARILYRSVEPPRAKAAGVGALIPLVLFAAVYWVVSTHIAIPLWILWVYVAASVVTFAAYAIDKSSAKVHGQRISEATLLTLGFLGGWPGAILGQLAFRHKTSKPSFRSAFWTTVVANVLVLVVAIGVFAAR